MSPALGTIPSNRLFPFELEFVLASDVSTGANTTPVDLPGFAFNLDANSQYVLELFGAMQSPANTTGYGLQVNLTLGQPRMQFNHQLANTGTLSGGSSFLDDTSAGVSSGVPTNATDVPFYASGVIVEAGFVDSAQLRLRSETTAVATMKAGTVLRVRKVGN